MLWTAWLEEVRHLTEPQFLEKNTQSAILFTSTYEDIAPVDAQTPEKTALPSLLKKETRRNLFKKLEHKFDSRVIYFLDPAKRVRIGRSADSDIHLPLKGISRIHAKLIHMPNSWIIHDMGSINGTFLNGKKLTMGLPYVLDGDEVVLDFGSEALALYCTPAKLWALTHTGIQGA